MNDLDRLRVMNRNPEDYRSAVGHEGPLGGEWGDKPHRLIYDLVFMVKQLSGALHDVVECQGVHDIVATTGLPEARAQEIHEIFKLFAPK